jgi:hypothetical protein
MGIFKILGIILLSLILLIAGLFVYFYNFHVFKVVRTCISNTDIQDMGVSCTDQQFCINYFLEQVEGSEKIEQAPEFAGEFKDQILAEAIICGGTCKVKKIYGELFGEEVGSCVPGDKEILTDIRGKEAIALLRVFKANSINS